MGLRDRQCRWQRREPEDGWTFGHCPDLWSSAFWPRWGQGDDAMPATMEPLSPGSPPPDVRDVRPCDWGNLGPGLCIYPSGGGVPTKILEDVELDASHSRASWGPDGQRIAFAAVKPGGSPGQDTNVYIVNADGTGLTELPSLCNDLRPSWSPDGEWLAFHSCGDVAIMHPDGSDPTVIWSAGGDTLSFEWSPDSQWMVFSSLVEGSDRFPLTREVWVISRDGVTATNVATLTHDCDATVAFSPDGARVAYFDADCRPMIVNADGSEQPVPLTDFPDWWTSSAHPQWGGGRPESTLVSVPTSRLPAM